MSKTEERTTQMKISSMVKIQVIFLKYESLTNETKKANKINMHMDCKNPYCFFPSTLAILC